MILSVRQTNKKNMNILNQLSTVIGPSTYIQSYPKSVDAAVLVDLYKLFSMREN